MHIEHIDVYDKSNEVLSRQTKTETIDHYQIAEIRSIKIDVKCEVVIILKVYVFLLK